jgi:SAM-dependent methyltransferase
MLGPPLRPSPEDVATIERVARDANAQRALILGVTPEVATCAWPEGARLTAVDVSEEMIARVWPATAVSHGARAIRGDWRALPLEDASVDFVTGDGVLTVLAFPDDTRTVLREARRVLGAGGHLVVRAFVPPAVAEEPRAIAADLRRGGIGSFHAFRWRLCMALHESSTRGVRIRDVWTLWRELVPDPRALFAELGWNEDALEAIDLYRDSPVTYAFPTQAEIVTLARDLFDFVSADVPTYELGERCPTLVFRARANDS